MRTTDHGFCTFRKNVCNQYSLKKALPSILSLLRNTDTFPKTFQPLATLVSEKCPCHPGTREKALTMKPSP